MNTVRLTFEFGALHWPTGAEPSLLVRRYDAGDMDTCPWPADYTDPALAYRLARALYDERETNDTFADNCNVELPDGTTFDFDLVLMAHESQYADKFNQEW